MPYHTELGAWEDTPKWHPFRWLGWRLRRRYEMNGCGHYDSWWGYGRPRKVARQELRRLYDTEDKHGENARDGYRSATWFA